MHDFIFRCGNCCFQRSWSRKCFAISLYFRESCANFVCVLLWTQKLLNLEYVQKVDFLCTDHVNSVFRSDYFLSNQTLLHTFGLAFELHHHPSPNTSVMKQTCSLNPWGVAAFGGEMGKKKNHGSGAPASLFQTFLHRVGYVDKLIVFTYS